MAKLRGVDVLVEIDLDQLLPVPTGVADWTVVGGQQGATLSEESEAVDVTTKDSAGWAENDYGILSWSVSMEGMYIIGDEGYQALKDAQRGKKKVQVRIKEAGQPTETGLAVITSREFDAPYDGNATYSVELQGDGALTESA